MLWSTGERAARVRACAFLSCARAPSEQPEASGGCGRGTRRESAEGARRRRRRRLGFLHLSTVTTTVPARIRSVRIGRALRPSCAEPRERPEA
jgi:hypothetical protein